VHIVPQGGGDELTRKGSRIRVKASALNSRGVLSCLETNDPSGYEAHPHVHRASTEAFYVLSGLYAFLVGDEEVSCGPGSFVLVPSGSVHGYRVGNEGGRLLIIYVPAGIEQMFRDLGPDAGASLTDEQFAKIAGRYDTEWVGRTG